MIVPKMVYRLGLFRPPRESSTVTGPEAHEETRHIAVINTSRGHDAALAYACALFTAVFAGGVAYVGFARR